MSGSRKLGTALASGLVGLAFLLGAGAAQAAEVLFEDPADETKATRILDLVVDGVVYDVTFLQQTVAFEIYGLFPGPCVPVMPFEGCALPPFGTDELPLGAPEALEALDAANAELTAAEAFSIGEVGVECGVPDCANAYNIAFRSWILSIPKIGIFGPFTIPAVTNARAIAEGNDWFRGDEDGLNSVLYNLDVRNYAIFEPAGGAPPPWIDFSADPEVIQSGGSSTLFWDVEDADSCDGSMGSPGWPGAKDEVSGSEDVSPIVTSIYVLTCDGPGGQSEEQVTVMVPEPGATLSMVAALVTLGAASRVRRGRRSEV